MPQEARQCKPKSYRSLSILPEETPLRRSHNSSINPEELPFLEPLNYVQKDKENTPRALRGLSQIIEGGLCHRCGSCVGICPTGVLGLDEEDYPTVKHLSACTDCDLCVRVCPGDEFNFQEMHQEVFQLPADPLSTHGHFRQGVIGYACDPKVREHSTSGGLVTAILSHLLETDQIDGALVIASDEAQLWKGKPIVARSKAELLAAMKSKYAICPTNALLSEVRNVQGRYALVGLPCQIHGFHKAAALDTRIKNRVVLSIALFCHAAIEHEAFNVIWESLGEKASQSKRFISRVGKHPGTPHIEMKDGSLFPVYFGKKQGYRPTSIEVINILYRLYTPVRCTTCFDGLGDYADISVGDPWMAPPEDHVNFYQGWSFALLRTKRGEKIYNDTLKHNKIVSLEITRREALASNILMASEKRWRAFRVIETHRRQGKPIPLYGDCHAQFPRHTGIQFLKTELHMLSHIFCFLPNWRASVLRFFLGNGGYWLFWLNSVRRGVKVYVRDSLSRARRSLVGRE